MLGHLVTVWELAQGGTLLDRLKEYQRENGQTGLPLDELMPYMEQLAEAVDFLTSRGIYHRDIKPQNVFLFGTQVKLGDLGFLKLAGISTASHTGIGTPGYLPLEAYPKDQRSKGQLHPSIDVYGLAATYVHLRTGEPPFGEPHALGEVLERQKRGEPCMKGMYAAEVEWVRQAVSPDRNRWPQTAKTFVQELVNRLTLALSRAETATLAVEMPQLSSIRVYGVQRHYAPGTLPGLSEELLRLQRGYLALVRTMQQVEEGTHPNLQGGIGVVRQAEAEAERLQAEFERLPLPGGVSAEMRHELWEELEREVEQPPSFFLRKCPGAGMGWAFLSWAARMQGVVQAKRRAQELAQRYEEARQRVLEALQKKQAELRQELQRSQCEDLWRLLQGARKRYPGAKVLPVSLWLEIGPRLEERYVGWAGQELLQLAEELWSAPHPQLPRFTPSFEGHADSVRSVAVTPDGRYVVSGSSDKTIRLWDLSTGQEIRRFTGHDGMVFSVAVTPDGRYVVSGSYDNTIRLWDLSTGREIRRFTGHDGMVFSIAVTPDGRYVVSGSRDKTVRVWYIGDLK